MFIIIYESVKLSEVWWQPAVCDFRILSRDCVYLNVPQLIQCVRKVAVHLGYGTVRVEACIDARGHHFQHVLLSAQRPSERSVEMSYNKERSSSYTTLAGWSLKWRRNVFSFNTEMNVYVGLHCVTGQGP
jgi:hypothetical protein